MGIPAQIANIGRDYLIAFGFDWYRGSGQTSGGHAGRGGGELLRVPAAVPYDHADARHRDPARRVLRRHQLLPHYGLPELGHQSHPLQFDVVEIPRRLPAPVRPAAAHRPPGHRQQFVVEHDVLVGQQPQPQPQPRRRCNYGVARQSRRHAARRPKLVPHGTSNQSAFSPFFHSLLSMPNSYRIVQISLKNESIHLHFTFPICYSTVLFLFMFY